MGEFETKPPTPPLWAASRHRPYSPGLLAAPPGAAGLRHCQRRGNRRVSQTSCPILRSLERNPPRVQLLLLCCPAASGSLQEAVGAGQSGSRDNLPGQPVPGLRHPQREEVLPHVQLELPLLQFVLKQPIFTLPLEKAVLGW